MNIKQLRLKHNLSQQDVANKTGIPRPRLAKWEEGKGKPKAEDSAILDKFFAELGEVIQPLGESSPPLSNPNHFGNLTESNRLLAESNSKMVDAILSKMSLLDSIKSNLDRMPAAMKDMTQLALKSHESIKEQILLRFAEVEQKIQSASSVRNKTTSGSQRKSS